jgi:indolepyruvate ferredoxin oxidoreductase
MVRDVHARYPDDGDLRAGLDSSTRAEHNRYLDAIAVTENLFGDSTTANMFMIGVAYQIGALPVSIGALEQAIELNGAAVEANKLALHWGRMWVVDPERVREASRTVADLLPTPSASLEKAIVAAGLGEGELGRLVRLRAGDLTQYQDERYARKYLDTVKVAAQTGHTAFAEAVARYLYKLMAYKDEYEVARLHLEEAARLQVENAVGTDVVVSFNLLPPAMRAMGRKEKIRLGPWAKPALVALQRGKRLRGTKLDPFGRAEVRRVERELITEYDELIREVARLIDDDNAALATELASLPDLVRDYEDIKLRNVELYHLEMTRLRSDLGV